MKSKQFNELEIASELVYHLDYPCSCESLPDLNLRESHLRLARGVLMTLENQIAISILKNTIEKYS